MELQVLLLTALISLSVAQLEVPGRLVDRSSTRTSEPIFPPCNGIGVYSECRGCSKVLVCMGSTSDEKNCATISPDTPFCVDGGCTASRDRVDAGCFPPPMTCTDVGYFPDPNLCIFFHYCERIYEEAALYVCPQNYVYNAVTNLCKLKLSSADCVTVHCDPSKTLTNYGTSTQFYAYCQYSANYLSNIIMMKCAPYTHFDGTTCVFRCPNEGNFQHSDPSKYYQCYISGGNIVYQVQNCGLSTFFDQDRQVCLPIILN